MKRLWGAFFLALLLCAAGKPLAQYALPLDDSGGMLPEKGCFQGDELYEDPTIRVSIDTGRMFSCDYWAADIVIRSGSQLRTAAARSFDAFAYMDGKRLAERVNAVLAINGDFYAHAGSKYVLRQGVLYADTLRGKRDILVIDEAGDFHPIHLAGSGSVGKTVDGKAVANVLCFGPILVENGEAVDPGDVGGIAANEGRQRVCIAQAGPLHYKVICCASHRGDSRGMTIRQFAELAALQGVQVAYNLDGGDSAMLYFHGKKLNDRAKTAREICDIVYFASAWPELPEETVR